jgi:membrane-associated phospholipid phosphatase
MLLWAGLFFLTLGVALFAVDRRAAHFFHDRINLRLHRAINRTTDWAKGAHWLAIAIVIIVAADLLRVLNHDTFALDRASYAALAFIICLALGTIIVHILKIFLGRRRPRDELEHSLYGFMPLRFSLQYDSFPSGHALTIVCVAVIFSSLFPMLAPLWFAIALYLSMTRAFVNAHFLSDVSFGIGLGLLTSREVVSYLFPLLFRPWF